MYCKAQFLIWSLEAQILSVHALLQQSNRLVLFKILHGTAFYVVNKLLTICFTAANRN